MGIITSSAQITTKAGLNHMGSPGDNLKILYTPNGGSEITVFEYVVDAGKKGHFTFDLKEITET